MVTACRRLVRVDALEERGRETSFEYQHLGGIASDMCAGTEIESWFTAMHCRDDAVHAQLAASCLLDGPF
jgi:hypothetical protein